MDFEMQPYGVYIKTDEEQRIIAINSDAFLTDTVGWVKVDEGFGDRYHHAQGNFLPGPIMDERGIYRYKFVNGKVMERTQEEMDADMPVPDERPTIESRVETVEGKTTDLEEALEMILSGVLE